MTNTERLLDILEGIFDNDKSLLSYEDLETYYDIAKSLGRTYRLLEVQNEMESRLEPKKVKPFAGLWKDYTEQLFV